MNTADAAGEVVVREATEEDIPRLVELLEHGSLTEGKEDATDLSPYRAALAEIARGPGAVLVAEIDGQVVGVCQLIVFRHLQTRGGRCAEVESVHVHPDHRGAASARYSCALPCNGPGSWGATGCSSPRTTPGRTPTASTSGSASNHRTAGSS